MDKKELIRFKQRLLQERENIENLLKLMKKNDTIVYDEEMSSELSTYDNHPADMGEELFNKEKGLALKKNEMNILNKIQKALNNIEAGSYGICQGCGKKINPERLEFIPYAEYCVKCQNNKNIPLNYNNSYKRLSKNDFHCFHEDYNKSGKNKDFKLYSESSYEDILRFNRLENVYDEYVYEDTEDPIENISNEEYKKTLE